VRLSVAGASIVTVPDLVGRQLDAAKERLSELGLTAVVVLVDSNAVAGTVVAQHPAAGSDVGRGSSVSLSVSGGPGP
jgi:serine/threonine-protein kinase